MLRVTAETRTAAEAPAANGAGKAAVPGGVTRGGSALGSGPAALRPSSARDGTGRVGLPAPARCARAGSAAGPVTGCSAAGGAEGSAQRGPGPVSAPAPLGQAGVGRRRWRGGGGFPQGVPRGGSSGTAAAGLPPFRKRRGAAGLPPSPPPPRVRVLGGPCAPHRAVPGCGTEPGSVGGVRAAEGAERSPPEPERSARLRSPHRGRTTAKPDPKGAYLGKRKSLLFAVGSELWCAYELSHAFSGGGFWQLSPPDTRVLGVRF